MRIFLYEYRIDLIFYLTNEKAEFVISPELGILLEGIAALSTGELNLNTISHWGDPLGSDFQFRIVAKRKSKKQSPFPQRFHGRVYLAEQEIVVVTETETDPRNIQSGLQHLSETTKHRIIRLKRKPVELLSVLYQFIR